MTSHPPSYKFPCSCLCKEELGDESKLIQVRTGQAQRDASIKYYSSLQPLAPEKLPEPRMASIYLTNAADLLSMNLSSLPLNSGQLLESIISCGKELPS